MLKALKYLYIIYFDIASQLVTAQPATFENSILNIHKALLP
jgi:hypothetical protein